MASLNSENEKVSSVNEKTDPEDKSQNDESTAAATKEETAAPADQQTKYSQLMTDGKRAFFCEEYESSSELFSLACEEMAAICGDERPHEQAESLYYYGSSLLELARKEQCVFGDKLTKQNDDNEEGDSDDGDEGEDKGEDEEEEEEEANNWQIAFETLELARCYYLKHDDLTDEVYSKVAKCSVKLGDMGLEIERYEQTITSMNECIEIYKRILPSDVDRAFASCYYCLGLAYSEEKQFREALRCMAEAVRVLNENVKLLKADGEKGSGDQAGEELKNMEEQLKEIKFKLLDIKEMEKAHILSSVASNGAGSSGFSNGAGSSSNGAGSSSNGAGSSAFSVPEQAAGCSSSNGATDITSLVRRAKPTSPSPGCSTSDISHLVRRKREDETSSASATTESSASDVKKRRIRL